MPTVHRLDRGGAAPFTIAALLFGLILTWALVTPPGAAADEPSHLTRSAALIRNTPGRDGVESREFYTLPDWIEVPEPACYAFKPGVSAVCAEPIHHTGAPTVLSTRADEYPPTAHVLYGLATLVPHVPAVWPARILGAVLISALLAASLVERRRRGMLSMSGLFVAMTPMAWGSFAVVNPTSLTLSGAIALWTATIELAKQRLDATADGTRDQTQMGQRTDRLTAWLLAIGWAACVLPRRDGMIWACIVVGLMVVATDLPLSTIMRRIGAGPLALVVVSSLAMVVWAASNGSPVTRLMAAAPLVLVGAEGVRVWRSRATTTVGRIVPLAATAIAAVAVFVLVETQRSGGANRDLTLAIIRHTPRHLNEAIGVLGWLDTPIPRPAVWGWVILVLIAGWSAAKSPDRRWLAAAAATFVIAVVTAWTLELASGNNTGLYWQGRYSLPLLVGIALLATSAPWAPAHARSSSVPEWLVMEANVLTLGSIALMNVAAWAASRRWAVGIEGTLRVTQWPSTITPMRPALTLVLLAGLSVALAVAVLNVPAHQPDASGSSRRRRLRPSSAR